MSKELDGAYSILSKKKRDRKSIEKKMPENWEFGNDSSLFKKKRRKAQVTTAKPRPQIITLNEEELIPPPTKDINLNKLEDGPTDIKWRSWPLDKWLENTSNPEGKDFEDIKSDLLASVEKIILDDNFKDPHKVSRPRKRLKKTTEEIPDEVIDAFFDDDKNEEEFGLDNPTDYESIRELLYEYSDKECILRQDNSVKFDEKNVLLALGNLEACSKSYCSNFLREFNNKAGERACINNDKCIFIVMAKKYPDNFKKAKSDEGFVCREFLLPSELEAWKKDDKLPMRKMCLGCNRYFTTKWHYTCLKDKVNSSTLIQDHYNETGTTEGYATSACIYPNVDPEQPPRVVRPIIEFKPEFYIYSKIEMIGSTSGKTIKLKCVKESKVDF